MDEQELEEIKEKVKRSNKYILYVEFNDIEKLLKYTEKLINDLREERSFTKSALETLKECVHKDTIKEKIKEVEERRLEEGECELALHGFMREAKIEVLKELLGE